MSAGQSEADWFNWDGPSASRPVPLTCSTGRDAEAVDGEASHPRRRTVVGLVEIGYVAS